MKYGLAIHTTTPQLGLALVTPEGKPRSQVWDLGRDLSTHLHVHLMDFIQPHSWKDLEWIGVAKGPGGFTGTRLGVVTARTLAQQLDIPLFALSTLATIAWSEGDKFAEEFHQETIAVEMQAQRGELFVAIYQATANGVEALLDDQVLTPEVWQQILANWQTPYRLIRAEGNLGETAIALLELAWMNWQQGDRPHWSTALPFYGQHPVVDH